MNNIKNIFRTGLAAVLLAGISASCSDESLLNQGGDGTVTFSAVLEDGTATRAFGDGTSAKQLRYAVYDNNGTLVTDGRTTVSNKTATVTLQLALGQTYDIAFFATRSLSTYTFNAADVEIYRYLLEKYALTAGECLFIDDRPDNVEGARAAGLQAVRFQGSYDQIKAQFQL